MSDMISAYYGLKLVEQNEQLVFRVILVHVVLCLCEMISEFNMAEVGWCVMTLMGDIIAA